MSVGARAGESADLHARTGIGAAVDVVGIGKGYRRDIGAAAGEERAERAVGELVTPQVSLPSVLNFFTTAHPSASVTLAATAARIRFPYTGIHRSKRPAPPLPTILPREA